MIQPLSEGVAAAGGWRVHKARRRDRVFEVIKIPAEVTTRGAICVQAQPAVRRGLHAGSSLPRGAVCMQVQPAVRRELRAGLACRMT